MSPHQRARDGAGITKGHPVTFFDDYTAAMEQYVDTYVQLEIINVTFDGDKLNVLEQGQFDVRITNTGPSASAPDVVAECLYLNEPPVIAMIDNRRTELDGLDPVLQPGHPGGGPGARARRGGIGDVASTAVAMVDLLTCWTRHPAF